MTEQGTLFNLTELYDRKLDRGSKVRNAIGECIQVFVVEFLRLQEIRIDGREAVCPDFLLPGTDVKGEIKSIGKNGRARVYKWRLEKENKHFDGKPFFYIFANHKIPITTESGRAIVESIKQAPPILYVCSLRDLTELLSPKKVRKFSMFEGGQNKRIGYNRAGYDQGGWQFSLREIEFNSCILSESTYCNQPTMTRIYYTDSSSSFVEKLQPVATHT